MKALMSGLLSPALKEKILGSAEIRTLFSVTKTGRVAGCMIKEGVIRRGAKARLLRDNVMIYTGNLKSLRRFKEEVREVKEGYECGIALENYQDIREGDTIECFEVEEIARQL
jgi:translation initiation factor IF-2